MRIPKDSKKVLKFFLNIVMPKDDNYQKMIELIPEYEEMNDKLHAKTYTNQDILKCKSWNIFMAIYDINTKDIITLHYGLFEQTFKESFVGNDKDVITLITQQYKNIR